MMNATDISWKLTSDILYNDTSNYTENMGSKFVYEFDPEYLRPVLNCLIFVVGFIGNALVVWVITMGAQLKSMADVCLLNMALADLLLVLSLPPLTYQINNSWIFGKTMCAIVFGMYYVGFYAGIFFIVLTSIDRYLAIVHALFALGVRTKTRGIVASLGVWIIAVAASFPELLNVVVRKNPPFFPTRRALYCVSRNPTSFVCFKRNIVSLLVPLSIVGFCYSMILWKLQRSQSSKKHSMRLIVMVMLVFFCCWMPYNVAEFLRGLQLMGVIPSHSKKHILLTLKICRAVAFSHSCLNPFLYVFVGKRFRKHLITLIRERRPICCS